MHWWRGATCFLLELEGETTKKDMTKFNMGWNKTKINVISQLDIDRREGRKSSFIETEVSCRFVILVIYNWEKDGLQSNLFCSIYTLLHFIMYIYILTYIPSSLLLLSNFTLPLFIHLKLYPRLYGKNYIFSNLDY